MAEELAREESLREAVGVFSDAQSMQQAIDDVLVAGFHQADLSVLATEHTVRGKLGAYYRDIHEAEDDPEAPRQAWAGPRSRTEGKAAFAGVLGYLGAMAAGGVVLATGGAAAAVIAAGVVAGGATAAVGASLGRLLDRHVGDGLKSQLEHGGILLWVRARDEECAVKASRILQEHGAHDVHVHELHMKS